MRLWTTRWLAPMAAATLLLVGLGCSDGGSDDEEGTTGDESAAEAGDENGTTEEVGSEAATEEGDENGGEEAGDETGTEEQGGENGGEGGTGDPKCAIPENTACNALCHTGCDDSEACLFLSSQWLCASPGETAGGGECNDASSCTAGACANTGDGIPICLDPCLDDDDCGDGGVCNANIPGAEPFSFCSAAPSMGCKPLVDGECDEGLSCYIANNSTQCLVPGDLPVGAPCSAPNDCAPDTVCLNVAGVSGCVRMCSTLGSDAGSEIDCVNICGIGNFQQIDVASKTGYCQGDVEFPICDPLNPDCLPGQGCVYTNQGWACLGTGNKEEGETCSGVSECQSGLVCFANKCKIICDPALPNGNPACESPDIPCVELAGGGYCDQ